MSKQTIKGYSYDEKEDKIGKGNFGTVFRARHIQGPNNEVAIKVIDTNKGSARRMPKEVKEREVEICKAILNKRHKNLVSLKDYEVRQNTTYLIMEFCGGGDFRGYLEEKKTLSESVIQQFFLQIVSGLEFLHDRNIVHRDLKPENILLSFTGEVVTGNRYPTPENIILKIADFGISRFLSSDGVAFTMCGTFVYMAPEILQRKPYGKEVDVWSIGVMVHECLLGKVPNSTYRNSNMRDTALDGTASLIHAEPCLRMAESVFGLATDDGYMTATIKEVKELGNGEEIDLRRRETNDCPGMMVTSSHSRYEGVTTTMKMLDDGGSLALAHSRLPAKTSKEMRELLQKLMAQKPQGRLNCEQILNHEFMRASGLSREAAAPPSTPATPTDVTLVNREQSVREYNYDEEPVLGVGSFGTVYLGWHSTNKNSKVAIKMINLRKSAVKKRPQVISDMEVKILQDLSATPHCNLVRLLDFQGTDSKLFFIMEYCNGGDLRKYLNVNGVLRPFVIRLFFEKIARGTEFLHHRGIIHRNLKPENILLSFDGEPYPRPEIIIIKIGDFGLERYLPEDDILTTYCGTFEYRAPEIKPGAQYDNKVDLWSIGVMIYECLVGSTTAQDLNDIKLLAKTIRKMTHFVLRRLLVSQPNHRLDIDRLLYDNFLHEHMNITVRGFGTSVKHLVVKKSSFVEELIEKIRSEFNITSDKLCCYLSDIPDLEQHCGHNVSLEECGISNMRTIDLSCAVDRKRLGSTDQDTVMHNDPSD